MIFYKCNTCGLLASETFKRCPSCNVEATTTQELYGKVGIMGRVISDLSELEELTDED